LLKEFMGEEPKKSKKRKAISPNSK
jgi:hypothetical protein